MTRPLTQRLAPLATAGAVVALAVSLASHHPDPATAAESGFLALLLGLTLVSLALVRRAAPALVAGGSLIALALCLPAADGTRGALVAALLVVTAGCVSWRAFASGRMTLLDCSAVTIAWQCILRSERLLDPTWTPSAAVWILALPLAAATATWWHGRRTGNPARPLVLVAAMALLGPGLGVVAVATLIVAAALARDVRPSVPAATVAAAACVAAIGWVPEVAPMLLVLVAALAFANAGRLAWLATVGAILWAALAPATSWSVVGLSWLLLALPGALFASSRSRPLLLAAMALALPAGAVPALLAPALALSASALPDQRAPRRVQAGWSLLLLCCAALTAAYPWLRDPLVHWPEVLSVPIPLLAATVVLMTGLAVAASRREPAPPRWAAPLALLLAIALAAAIPRGERLNDEPVVLTGRQAAWTPRQPNDPVRTLTVDSFLTRGAELPSGKTIAWILLTADDGRRQRLAVRKDLETADWAPARVEGAPRPDAWLTWHAADGTPARRYRARWRLEPPFTVQRIELVRAPDLPSGVELAVLAVTTR